MLTEKQNIEDDLNKMQLEVEFEERKALQKQDLFLQDLDNQVEEKAAAQQANKEKSDKEASCLKDVMVWEQKTRDKNQLAVKLTKIANDDKSVLGVSDYHTRHIL